MDRKREIKITFANSVFLCFMIFFLFFFEWIFWYIKIFLNIIFMAEEKHEEKKKNITSTYFRTHGNYNSQKKEERNIKTLSMFLFSIFFIFIPDLPNYISLYLLHFLSNCLKRELYDKYEIRK